MSTQPPYHTSTFGAPNQDPSTSTPIGTQVGAAPPTDPLTGPAPSTAGPHQSNMGNRFDPRVDSDLDNRAQYATGESHANPEHEAQYVPHGEQREHGTAADSSAAGSKSAQKGEQLGHSVKSLFAGVHGAGESLRGGLNAAVDKAFGHDEGAAKNADIASKGERQIQTGRFSGHGP